MEFLKDLFGNEALTYDQFTEKAKGAGKDGKGIKLADLSQGQYVAAEKYRCLEVERDTARQQMAEVGEKLKAFDGVDVAALRGEIDTLKGDIAKKEADFTLHLADRDFAAMLDSAILSAKGKNPKAVMALLDTDTLKSSKNQKEDISAAIKKLAESDAYLFGEADNPTPVKISTGGKHTEPGSISADPFIAGAMKGAGLESGKEG